MRVATHNIVIEKNKEQIKFRESLQFNTTILPPDLYRCKTWPVSLGEELILTMSDSSMLKGIYGQQWTRPYNEEPQNANSSPNIIRIMEQGRMRRAKHVTSFHRTIWRESHHKAR
jgi:hypothetical protein